MSEEQTQEAFYFDDFFVEEGASVPVEIEVKGRKVPLRVKPGLSIDDIQAAQAAGVKRVFIPGKGVKVEGIDEAKVTSALLARYVVEWPFVSRDGRKVPITPDNCRKLIGEAAQQLIALVKSNADAEDEAQAPFELR